MSESTTATTDANPPVSEPKTENPLLDGVEKKETENVNTETIEEAVIAEPKPLDKVPDDTPEKVKPYEEKPAEEKPAEEKPAEKKPDEEKPAEEKPAEKKPDEEKPAEEKPVEEKPDQEEPEKDVKSEVEVTSEEVKVVEDQLLKPLPDPLPDLVESEDKNVKVVDVVDGEPIKKQPESSNVLETPEEENTSDRSSRSLLSCVTDCNKAICSCGPIEVQIVLEEEEAKNKAYSKATDSVYDSSLIVDSKEFDFTVTKLREFFKGLGFLEAHPQNRLSILAACEDPFTVAQFDYAGKVWPLPQTGQMWLEYELLKNPEAKGFFCLSTSYRQEQTPVEGRHDLIFPLFEFEMHGGLDALLGMEKDLLKFLGYDESKFVEGAYNDIAKEYGVEELENEQEAALAKDKSPTFFLKDFPESTDPFWNMRRYDGDKKGIAKKVDVILSGQETFGSAEREVDKEVMRERFNTISDGGYKKKLYDLFGQERTDKEMDDYFKFDFFERCGGGIGVTRLIRSLKTEGLMPDFTKKD